MILFIDTSALIKRYIAEDGSDRLEAYFLNAEHIVLSMLASFELQTTIARKLSDKAISKQIHDQIMHEWQLDARDFEFVPIDGHLLHIADQVNRKSLLKTLDVIQLSCAIARPCDHFLTSDKQLFAESKKFFKGTKSVLI